MAVGPPRKPSRRPYASPPAPPAEPQSPPTGAETAPTSPDEPTHRVGHPPRGRPARPDRLVAVGPPRKPSRPAADTRPPAEETATGPAGTEAARPTVPPDPEPRRAAARPSVGEEVTTWPVPEEANNRSGVENTEIRPRAEENVTTWPEDDRPVAMPRGERPGALRVGVPGSGRHHREAPSALRRSTPRRARRRHRRLRAVLISIVVLAVTAALGVIVLQWLSTPATTGLRLAAGDGASGDTAFAIPAGGTGSTQVLNAVAVADNTIVAAGSDTTSPVPRPLFLMSPDGGESWQLGNVTGQGGHEPGPTTVGLVAGGDGRWVAAENGRPDGPVRGLWVSSDGFSWETVPPDRLTPFRGADHIADLARTASGFVAVGSTVLDDGTIAPIAWTSTDGEAWTRVASRDIGPPDRLRAVVAVAARDDAVVALAAGPTDTSSIVLHSADGGHTWRHGGELPLRPRPGSLATTSRGFVVVPLAQRDDDGDVPVYCSATGAEWSSCGAIGDLPRDSTGVSGIASSASGVTVLAERGLGRYTAYTSPNGADWRERGDIEVPGVLRALAVSDRGTLVVGGDRRSSDVDNQIVLMAGRLGGAIEPVDLGEVDGLIRIAREIGGIAAARGRYVAAGTAVGDAAIWTSADGRQWDAVIFGGPRVQELSDVAHGPKGWVAVGGSMRDSVVVEPLIVTSADGRSWTRVEITEALAPTEGHHFLAPHVVAAGEAGYVLAGEDRDQGGVRPALWFTPDLRRYTRTAKLPAEGTGVRVHDVTATATGYVAVGGSGAGVRETAVVWVSDDGVNWTDRSRVRPPGARSFGLRHVVSFGDRIVAVGTAAFETGVRQGFAAVSRDMGETWEYGRLPADQAAAVRDLAVTAEGMVAVGWHGLPAESDSAAWTSRDGLEWEHHPLTRPTLTGPGAQWLDALTISAGEVMAIGRSTTYSVDRLTIWRTTFTR